MTSSLPLADCGKDEAGSPLVSVVTASFNALEGLRQTVESVASQTFASVEHIVIDGGSGDGTRAYLEALGDAVRWISEPDQGIADALNKGIEMARGQYILVLQAEDVFLDPSSLAMAAPHLDTAQVVSFAVIVVRDGKSRVVASRGFGPKLEFFMTVPHQGAFIAREIYERLGPLRNDLKVAMDYDLMLHAKREGVSCRVVAEPLAVMPATGISSRLDRAGLEARLGEFRRVQERYAPDRFQWAHRLFWRFYPPYKYLKTRLRA